MSDEPAQIALCTACKATTTVNGPAEADRWLRTHPCSANDEFDPERPWRTYWRDKPCPHMQPTERPCSHLHPPQSPPPPPGRRHG